MTLPAPAFAAALHWGLGRALQQLAARVTPERREAVLDACLHCRSFDPQLEGQRSVYLLQVARLAGLTLEPPLSEKIRALNPDDFDHWDTAQQLDLLVALAKEGNEAAARTIREAYARFGDHITGLHELIAEIFIALDGVSALERVMRDEARAFAERQESTGGAVLWQAELQLGKAQARRVIRRLERQEPQVAAFVEAFRWNPGSRRRPQLPRTLAEVYEFIDHQSPKRSRMSGAAYFRFVKMPRRDWLRLQNDLQHEAEAGRRALLVSVFRFQPTRWGIEPLLDLLADPDEQVVAATLNTLEAHAHPRVRALALKLLQQPERAGKAVTLLVMNAEPGDTEVIRQALARQHDSVSLHNLLYDLPDLVRRHPLPEFADLLAESYACQPCSHCRCFLAETLRDITFFPDWLREEALLDASQEVRDVAAGLLIP